MGKKKYQIVYADPPWQYNDKMTMTGTHGMIRGAESFYSTMPIDKIKSLPVKDITDKNCILFIWVTMPLLQEGLDTISAWGFKYKTCGFTWIKKTKTGKNHCGMGHYTRSNAELCLIGTKGKVEILDKSISQIIESPIREHSRKPDVARKLITDLVGDLPRIELFARGDKTKDLFGFNKFEGWHTAGNHIDNDVNLNGFEKTEAGGAIFLPRKSQKVH